MILGSQAIIFRHRIATYCQCCKQRERLRFSQRQISCVVMDSVVQPISSITMSWGGSKV